MTTIIKDQMLLKDNEVYFVSKTLPPVIGWWCIDTYSNIPVLCNEDNYDSNAFDYFVPITHSTAKLEGVKHLQREWFVKEEDLEEMANNHVKTYGSYMVDDDVIDGFKAGYNAKKAEFTKQQLMDAMYDAFEYPNKRTPETTITEFVERYVRDLQPLLLPEKIVLSPDGELVEIQWL